MARRVKPLTATQVLNAKPKDKAYKLFDGAGFSYRLRRRGKTLENEVPYRPMERKVCSLSARTPPFTLERARKMRDEARSQKAAGFDPGEVRRQEKRNGNL